MAVPPAPLPAVSMAAAAAAATTTTTSIQVCVIDEEDQTSRQGEKVEKLQQHRYGVVAVARV